MQTEELRVLLVEDNPGDVTLVREMLSAQGQGRFKIVQAARLDEALALLAQQPFDVVLLDLSLPNSAGVETLDKTRTNERARETPIVVLTGRKDIEGTDGDAPDIASMQHGADDYLTKNSLRADILVRSIQLAVERQRLRARLARAEDDRRQSRELASLQSMQKSESEVSAATFGIAGLAQSAPDAFDMLVEQYCTLAIQCVETRKFHLERKPVQNLRVIAQRLGFLRAGPRDVVALHTTALRRLQPEKLSMSYAVTEEARLLLIELMGNLAAYYRDHMMPGRQMRQQVPTKADTEEDAP